MLNKVLERQIAKHFGSGDQLPEAVISFFNVISETYDNNEKDRKLLEHSMEINSSEMIALNEELSQDILERKLAEAEKNKLLSDLKTSEDKFRSLFQNAGDPMLLLDEQQHFIDCNEATLKIFGAKNKSEVLQKTAADISPEYQPDGQLSASKSQMMDSLAFNNGSNLFEWTCKRFDGSIFQVEVSLTIIPIQNKNVLLVHLNDLTERKKIENLQKLEEQNALLKKHTEQVPGVIYQFHVFPDGSAIAPYVSKGIEDLFEVDFESVKHNPVLIFSFVHPDDVEAVRSSFLRSLYSVSVWTYECRIVLPTRGTRWISGSAKPEKLKDGGRIWNGYVNDITDKKIAEQLIKESEAQFRDIFNNTDELIQNVSIADGKFLYVNPSWLKALEYREAEVKGLTFMDIIHPESREHCMQFFERICKGESIDQMEAVFISKTGKKLFVEGQAGCYLKDGVPYSTRGLFRNVTESKLAQELILREKELSNSIINNLPGIFYLYDEDGKFLRWNKNFEILSGYSSAEIAGMHPLDFYDAADKERVAKRITEGFVREMGGIELSLLTKYQKRIPLFINSMSILYEGKPCRLGMGIDISERKNAEKQLLKNQMKFEEAQELAHIGSWELNFETHGISWSKEMYRLFELEGTPDHQLQQAFRGKLYPDDLPEFDNAVKRVIGKAEVNSVECRIVGKDGEIKYVLCIGEPLKSSGQNKVIGLRGTVQDITLQKKAAQHLKDSKTKLRAQQEELMQTNRVLEENALLLKANIHDLQQARLALDSKAAELATASKYKSEFLANMSHELRTPLNSILILSKLLQNNKEKNLTARQIEFAMVIQKSGEDLLRLINDVLDLAKVESGKTQIDISSHNIQSLANDMELLFKAIAAEKEIAFSVALNAALPQVINTDIGKVGQILKNLLSNAFKFTEKNGAVSMTMRTIPTLKTFEQPALLHSKQVLEIAVKDNGIGIPKDKQRLVFMAFQQADGSTQRKYGGTGLGLSISKELIRLLGGELKLESEEGRGSVFKVYLPLTAPEMYAAVAKDKVSPQQKDDHNLIHPLAGKTILLADDDPRNVFALSTSLQEAGIIIKTAVNGMEAVEIIEKDRSIDAVLMDIMMPLMDGCEATKKIRDNGHISLPVIGLTARAMKADADKCLEAGMNDCMSKPVDVEQLLEVLGGRLKVDV